MTGDRNGHEWTVNGCQIDGIMVSEIGHEWIEDGDRNLIPEIGQGLLVLVGLLETNTAVDSEFMFVPILTTFAHVHSCYSWAKLCIS